MTLALFISSVTMKFFLCLAVIALIVKAYAQTEEELEIGKIIDKECKEESGVAQEYIDKLSDGEFIDDDKLKAFVLCGSKKRHLVNEYGETDAQLLRLQLKKGGQNEEAADRIVGLCVVKKDTPEDTAYHTYKCLRTIEAPFSPVD